MRNEIQSTFIYCIERFPSKPYIKEGYPKNVTALVNSTVILECPQIVEDLLPFIQWIYSKTPHVVDGSNLTSETFLEVFKYAGGGFMHIFFFVTYLLVWEGGLINTLVINNFLFYVKNFFYYLWVSFFWTTFSHFDYFSIGHVTILVISIIFDNY